MRLVEASGFVPTVALSKGQMQTVLESALSFLRAGGVLSFADWESFSPDERAAFETAGTMRDVNDALRIAIACSGEDGRNRVRAEVDDGKSLAQGMVDAAAARLAEKMSGVQVENR